MFDWLKKRRHSPIASAFETDYPMVATGAGGFLGGVHVASNLGWRPAEALAVGDQVLTFDHGMQPITEIRRQSVMVPEAGPAPHNCPLLVPQDALHNRTPLWVLPDQGVLLESELAEDAQGDPFVVVPACALEGYRGIRRAQPAEQHMQLVTLGFANDEVVYVEAGMLGYCPAQRDLLQDGSLFSTGLYRVLDQDAARDLVLDLIVEETFWAPDMPAGAGGGGEARAYYC